jgi:hypothetical protein
MNDYESLSDFDAPLSERELASEIKALPSRRDHLSRAEISAALDVLRTGILGELRNEAKASEKRIVEVCMGAVAAVLVEQRKQLRALEAELAVLKEHGGKRVLKVVEPDQGVIAS